MSATANRLETVGCRLEKNSRLETLGCRLQENSRLETLGCRLEEKKIRNAYIPYPPASCLHHSIPNLQPTAYSLQPTASTLQPLLRRAFTLIELLIVVAIIAILAAIAVPNFLEAQVRAKVSRARSDQRAIATGLEAYVVDRNHYPPNDGVYNVVPVEITTPVAYLTSSLLVDPFSDEERHPVYGELARFYTYTRIVSYDEFLSLASQPGARMPPVEAVDSAGFNPNALAKYGRWRLVSNGPDRRYSDPDYVFGSDPLDPNGVLLGSDVPYDATNGTQSKGNILRTQK